MKFLATSTNSDDPTPHIPAEIARTAELVEAGVLERVLLKADRSGAVLLLDVPDAAAARAAVNSLPLVQHGVTRFDLTEVVEAPAPVS
jgi:hypothetical protein